MLQIEFISDQKSQHTAMLKSENTVFPNTNKYMISFIFVNTYIINGNSLT